MPFASKTILPVLPKPNHLSSSCQARSLSEIDDKELRKKLRNRQSALAARERKKARMLELERNVAELQQLNKSMEDENRNLRCMLSSFLRASGCKNEGEMISNMAKGNYDVSVNVNKPTQKVKRMPPLIADFKAKAISQNEVPQSNTNLPKNLVVYSRSMVSENASGNPTYTTYTPIKSEVQFYPNTLQTIPRRRDGDTIIVKQEMTENNFENKTEVIQQIKPTANQEDTVFAQALKRKARAMVLSTSVENNNFPTQTQRATRKRQALPPIDAVFSSPSKKSTNTITAKRCNTFSNELVAEHRTPAKPFQPHNLISVHPSLTSNHSTEVSNEYDEGDPILSKGDFFQNINAHSLCSELPSELSDIIGDYNSPTSTDESDGLNLYDNLLEKSSSPDSGLGIDEDIDWMPSVFDFS